MAKQSAGILLYRVASSGLEVLLVHPGGPFWAKKDAGAWSIPKGEFQEGEDALATAKREFSEETGLVVHGALIPLGPAKQPSGKVIYAWALQGDCDAKGISSNLFTMEWPPRSGQQAEFPEVDRAEWFSVDEAGEKLLKGQVTFLERLREQIRSA